MFLVVITNVHANSYSFFGYFLLRLHIQKAIFLPRLKICRFESSMPLLAHFLF